MAENPYSRLYWSVMDDPKFDDIREDMRLFGAWAMLLIHAEMAFPSPFYRPPIVPAWALSRLVEAKLVDVLPGRRYRLHGLTTEREKRSQSARNAAAVRWQSERISGRIASRDELSKAKKVVRNTVASDPLLKEINEAYKAKEKDDA